MRTNIFSTAFLLMLLIAGIPAQAILISGHVQSQDIPQKDVDTTGVSGSRNLGTRSIIENGTYGGSWSEYFEKGSTAFYDGTYLYTDKMQLDLDPSSVTKYYNNPIVSTSVGKFDSNCLRGNTVIYDGGIYKMWYGGYDGNPNKIGYATSIDGRNWTKQNSGNPVLNWGSSGSWDDNGLYSVSVIKDGTTYKMWYTGHDGSYAIGYATSSDGIVWTKYASNPVFSGDGAGFDSSFTFLGSVIKDGAKYKMWYLGNNGGGAGSDRIGYAVSDDGLAWTRNANAVLALGNNGKFDSSGQRDPAVMKINSKYYMYYTGYDGANYRIGVAESWDGTTWTKMNNGNAVLGLGVWDSVNLIEHSFLRTLNQYYIYYAGGASATTTKIGHAFADDYLKTGSSISEKITLPKGMKWDRVDVKKAEPVNTAVDITVLDGITNKTISGFNNLTKGSFNISSINSVTHKTIRLLAYMTGPGSSTPALYKWGVSWVPDNTWRDTFINVSRVSSYNSTRFSVNNGQIQLDADPLNWTKDPANPVLTYGSSGWDNPSVMDPGLLKYSNNYTMFYSGSSAGQKAGYATSNNLSAWTKYGSNPVLSTTATTFDEFGIFSSDPVWLRKSVNLYYTGEQSTYRMGIGISVSGGVNSSTKYEKNPILVNSVGQWDANSVRDPSVLFLNGTYYMWYAGNQSNPAPVYKIGLAKSTDGLYWTKPSNNKVLDLGSNGKFDYYTVRYPSVVYDKDRFLMFYAGMDDPVKSWKIGVASSTDGASWTRLNNGNAIISPGANGQWDDTHATSVDVAKVGDLYEMFYVGDGGDGKYQIGHATSARYTQGTLVSEAITCPGNGLWNKLYINKTTPGDTTLYVTVLNANTGTAIPGFTDLSGPSVDISSLNSTTYPSIKLKAAFTGDGNSTPVLYDWAVNWTIAKIEQKTQIPDKSFYEEGTAVNLYDLSSYFTHKKISNKTLTYTIKSNSDPVNIVATIESDGYHMSFNAPTVNWTGNAQYTINVTDGYMNLTSNQFTVSVLNVNDSPVWLMIPDKHIVEDTPVDNLVNLTKFAVDCDTLLKDLVFTITNQDPVNMTVTLDANNNVDVSPADNYTGTVKVTAKVSDGQYSANTSFNIIVDAVNDKPVWTPFGPIQLTEDTPQVDIINLESVVKDAETKQSDLVYTVSVDPLKVDATISNAHKLSLYPAANYTGTTTLIFNVNDGFYTVPLEVVVIVSAVNDQPHWLNIPQYTLMEDTKGEDIVSLENYVIDAETAPKDLLYNVENVSEPLASVMIDANHHLDVYPAENYFGTIIIKVSASDGLLLAMTNITVIVTPVNDPPIITSTPPTTSVATERYQYQVMAMDIENDPLTYTLTSIISGMTIDVSTGLIKWTPTATQSGSYEIKLQVSDGKAAANQDYFLDVSPKASGNNNPPVITSEAPTDAIVGERYTYAVMAIDADKDPLTYSLSVRATGMTIKSATGVVDWTPQSGMEGRYPVVVAVSDGKAQVTQSFEVTVYPKGTIINHPPVITSKPVVKILIGSEYNYQVVATDTDGDILHYYLSVAPMNMTIDASNGLVKWTPTVDNLGEQRIIIRVSDGRTNVSQAYTLMVSFANHSPSMTSTPVTKATVGKPYSYQLIATDPDASDKLLYGLKGGPAGMSVDPSTGYVTWTPSASGTETVTVYVTDGIVQTNQTFDIKVTAKTTTGLDLASFPWWILVVIIVGIVAVLGFAVSRKRSKDEELPAAKAPTSKPHPVAHHHRAPVPPAAPVQRAPAAAPSSFKVEEVVDLDDFNDEPMEPQAKPEAPPKAKEVPKEPKAEKPTSEAPPPKTNGSTDDILDEILGKVRK